MAYRGTRVTLNIDSAKVRKHAGSLTERSVGKGARAIAGRARRNVAKAGRVNTGAMMRSIKVTKMATSTPMAPRFRVGSDLHYSRYQEWGIGPVYPKRASVLRFKPKGSNVYVFAKRTRGFPGAHFMRDAYRATSARDFL